MSKAKELAEQMFPEPQMENYDDILEYRNDRDWTFIAQGAVVKGYEQAEKDLLQELRNLSFSSNAMDYIKWVGDKINELSNLQILNTSGEQVKESVNY